MFRLAFADGGELILTEAGKKRRAGVWLFTPEGLDAELAHLGPEALGLGAERLGEILGRERRQLHPLLRDQRALAGIGRAHANEILWLAKLSPFKLSTDLSAEETERLAAAIDEDLERALVLREAGKGDAAVYRIHGHFGEPCPLGHDTLRRVAFEEHTITYCPTCQTGGKELKDRAPVAVAALRSRSLRSNGTGEAERHAPDRERDQRSRLEVPHQELHRQVSGERRAERGDERLPADPVTREPASSRSFSSAAAPMIGVASRNASRAASLCERPTRRPPAIVAPERENPGMSAIACARRRRTPAGTAPGARCGCRRRPPSARDVGAPRRRTAGSR